MVKPVRSVCYCFAFFLLIATFALILPSFAYAHEHIDVLTTQGEKATQGATTSSTMPVYWLVHKKSGENIYTASKNEVKHLTKVKKTWRNNGVMWYAPKKGAPVYRLVNKKTSDHHFTMSKNEVKQLTKVRKTWKMDFGGKPAFYSGGNNPVVRLRHDKRQQQNKVGTHMFVTTSTALDMQRQRGWKSEGALLYCVKYAPCRHHYVYDRNANYYMNMSRYAADLADNAYSLYVRTRNYKYLYQYVNYKTQRDAYRNYARPTCTKCGARG